MKKSSFVLCRAIALAAAVLIPSFAISGDPADASKTPAVDAGSQVWTQPLLGVGVKTSDVYTDGHLFITAPLWSTIGRDGTLGGDYVFLEPYSSLGDQGELATSLGLSWRHLFNNQSTSRLKDAYTAGFLDEGWYIGGNVFVDMLRTHADNKFWQAGFGLEIGSRYVELRGNYYLPFDGSSKLASQNVSEQTFVSHGSSSSSSSSTVLNTSGSNTVAAAGDPFATENSIQQSVTNAATARTTATTNTITTTAVTTTVTKVKTITSIYEEGMEGWDAELALLVPWVDQWMDVKLLGGYFKFNNQPFGPQSFGTGDVHGWKGGLELRPVPAIVIDALWFEDKHLTGSNWTVGVSLEIPIDKTWKDAFKTRRRHLLERLAEPVHRQNDAIKIGNSEDQTVSATSTSSTAVSSKSSSQTVVLHNATSNSTQVVTIKDNIIFVNNGGAVGNGIQAGNVAGNGTAEHPVNTVQAGSTLAGTNSNNQPGHVWTAYVQGTPTAYNENVSVIGSTSFFGSSQPITAKGGKVFGGTSVSPAVIGGFFNSNATPLSFVSYRGFQILGGASTNNNHAIDAQNVTTLIVQNNTIQNTTGSGAGVHVVTDDGQGLPATVDISSNNFANNGGNAVDIRSFSSSLLNATVSGNNFGGGGGDFVHTESHNTSTLAIATTGNSFVASLGETIHSASFGDSKTDFSTTKFTATNNTITDSAGPGIHLALSDSSKMPGAVISGNTISNTSATAIYVENNGAANLSSTTDVVVSNNIINTTTKGAGIGSNTINGSSSTFTITGNQLSNINGEGIALQNSVASGTGSSTLHVIAIDNNTVNKTTGLSGYGILSQTEKTSTSTFDSISNNTLTNISQTGINLLSQGITGTVVTVTKMDNNSITNVDGNGIYVDAEGLGGQLNASITNNKVTNAVFDGIRLEAGPTIQSAAKMTATVTGNTVNGVSQLFASGISALATNASVLTLTSLSNNTISNTPDSGWGIRVEGNGGQIIAQHVDSNHITGGASNNGGILFQSDGSGSVNFNGGTVNNNIITGVKRYGIYFEVPNGTNPSGISNGTVSGNQITTASTASGIFLESDSGGFIDTLNIHDNTLTGSGPNSNGIVLLNGSTGISEINGVQINHNTISGYTSAINITEYQGSAFELSVAVTNNLITTAANGSGIDIATANATGTTNAQVTGNTISGTPGSGFNFSNFVNGGKLNITQFDGNVLNTGYTGSGIFISGSPGPATDTAINGTLNNTVGAPAAGQLRLQVFGGLGQATGTIIINSPTPGSVNLLTTPTVP